MNRWLNGAGLAVLLASLMMGGALHAQDDADDEKKNDDTWDVDELRWETDVLEMDIHEGTWMSLDVSPDGKHIAFDLLGDIYVMPLTGGRATPLTRGPSYDVQPRFSPDGQYLSYTSDHGGADNIWIMKRDGSDPRAVTSEDFRLLNNAVWTPDSQYLVARKHFTSHRSLGAGEMWLYPVEGGKGLQLTTRRNEQQDAGEPCIAPDGKTLYWSEDMSPGGVFEYNKDPNGVIYVIRCLDLESGETRDVIRGPGGAVRPQISPDGKTLAFVRRVRDRSALFLRDLATGVDRPLVQHVSTDSQETWSVFGVYPNFNWTPDGQAIVYWAHGKIWKVNTGDGAVSEIPFTAPMRHDIHRALRYTPPDIGGDEFDVRVVRWPTVTPDGSRVVFQALGWLWVRDLPEGAPRRITDGDRLEYWPSLSRDGDWVTYVTWDDAAGGTVWKTRIDGGRSVRLTQKPGHYAEPSFSADARWVVYRRGRGDGYRGRAFTEDPGIYIAAASGVGEPRRVCKDGRRPRFWADGERIDLLSHQGPGGKNALLSVDLAGGDPRVHARTQYGGEMLLSADRRTLAFTQLFQVYVMPFPATGRAVDVSADLKGVAVRHVSHDGGEFLSWSGGGQRLHYGLGPDLYTVDVAAALTAGNDLDDKNDLEDRSGLQDKKARKEAIEKLQKPPMTSLGFRHPRYRPEGRLALVGARVISMRGDEIIEDGTVLIDGNRIAAVGPRDQVPVPAGTRTIDVTGQTLLPGFVDIHAHTFHSNMGISPRRKWAFLSELAFGVTTTHDPSNDTKMIFAESELVKSGRMVGPRVYSTGTILYGAEGGFKAVINSVDDARKHIRRLQRYGAFSVKSYNQPRRNQRQQVLVAARELGMMVVPEGGSMFHHNMSMILDGHTTVEHALPVAPLYEDVLTLFSRSRTGYTPTLTVGYGGLWGENYWYQRTEVWKNQRLLRFTPRSVVDPRARRRTLVPDEEFHHDDVARGVAEIFKRGGIVEVGAHGQMCGLDSHWEMWMIAGGGLTPHQMLRVATLSGARAIGLDGLLGSIETGKLADLIVLEADPLADISNTTEISLVMVDGRLYDGHTLDELHPTARPLPPAPYLDNIPTGVFHSRGCAGCGSCQ